MHIEDWNGQLIVKRPPIRLFVPVGLLFAASGLIASVFAGSVTDFVCNPTTCTLTTRYLLPIPPRHSEFALNTIEQARVQESRSSSSSSGTSYTYRVVLDTTTGTIPLTASSSSGRRSKENQADAINAFLANPQEGIIVRQNDQWLGIIFLFMFMGPGFILMAVGTTSTTLSFDRTMGTLSFDHKGLWGKRSRSHQLSDFTGIRLDRVVTKSSKGGSSTAYQIKLSRGSGDLTLGGSASLDNERELARRIQTYLNLPPVIDNTQRSQFSPRDFMGLFMNSPAQKAEKVATYRQQLAENPGALDLHHKLVMTLIFMGDREAALAHLEASRLTFSELGLDPQPLAQIQHGIETMSPQELKRIEQMNRRKN